MKKVDPKKPYERPQTREVVLAQLIVLHDFVFLKEGAHLYQGVITYVLNPEVVMVDLWPCDKEEETFAYYFELKELKFDLLTQTGFVFGRPHPESSWKDTPLGGPNFYSKNHTDHT